MKMRVGEVPAGLPRMCSRLSRNGCPNSVPPPTYSKVGATSAIGLAMKMDLAVLLNMITCEPTA
jgi:hypothetical protein